jgi:hypothetical protein
MATMYNQLADPKQALEDGNQRSRSPAPFPIARWKAGR